MGFVTVFPVFVVTVCLINGKFLKNKLGEIAVCCQDSSNATTQFIDADYISAKMEILKVACQGPARCAWMCQRDPTYVTACCLFKTAHIFRPINAYIDNRFLTSLTITFTYKRQDFFIQASRCSARPDASTATPPHLTWNKNKFLNGRQIECYDEKKLSCSLPYTFNGSRVNDCKANSTCLNGNGVSILCSEAISGVNTSFVPINLLVRNVTTNRTMVVPAFTKAGWLVIHQANVSSVESFKKSWDQYKYGFGNLNEGNYWLGNDYVSQMTWMMPNVTWRLHVSVQASANKKFYSTEYWRFRIKSEKELYAIELAGNVPRDAGDAFNNVTYPTWITNFRPFLTFDRKNDACFNCTCAGLSGWWYNVCGVSSLTKNPQDWGTLQKATSSANYSVIYSTMMIMIN
ncbi:hypothetical protein HELRODRAFT_159138 [Helobdella robusta]|uniref:Fibrinogen C-terminal domain-containing protein n=1 Tax=Helobdella robusta TaxID=6412 RepID=T1ENN1_HELRO|nr:hypothetical protein HELRODRAFT_159138 [Helobdella robusta]ESO12578.1 hypothetical protein HELRODRAFT_159138 [Helobdella robusta]